MTTTTREIDVERARTFVVSMTSDVKLQSLVEKYDGEFDQELRGDWVKMANYIKLREEGVSQAWAKMTACRRAAPMNGSDRDFNRHERHKMDRINPTIRSRMEFLAKRAGINTSGKFYVGALGYYDNPMAWVSTADDVRESAKRQGYGLEGTIEVKAEPLIGTRKDQGAVKAAVPGQHRKSSVGRIRKRRAAVSAS